MSRTVTALYDTRAEAEAARERLAAEVDLGSAHILDQQSHAAGGKDGSLNRLPLSHEDRSTFHEGIRRGGFLLTADVRGHEDADKIIRLLEESASVDLDRRQEQWRSDGWSASSAAHPNRASVSEEVIPVVEEELVVGRREVDRGGARVRSYVRDVPVHEEVTLREERVSVERRPLDRPLGAGDLEGDLLREREIEVTAKGEEAVVSKEARVREEVVVSKTEDQRVEQVLDKVARTEVDVSGGSTAPSPALGGLGAGASTFNIDRSPPSLATTDLPHAAPGVNHMAQNELAQNEIAQNEMAQNDLAASPAGALPEGGETTSSHIPAGTATSFPLGGAPAVPPPPVMEQYRVEEVRTAYRPRVETVVTERRETNRPSTALVIGSAVAGAIAGSVIPFMLVGRKSGRRRETLLIEDRSPAPRVGDATGDLAGRRTESANRADRDR